MSKVVNQEALRIQKIVAEGLTIAAETGDITGSKDSYVKALPEGLAIEDVRRVHTHDINFIEGSTRAHSDAALDLFMKNKKLEEVRTVVPTDGRDNIEIVSRREKEVNAGIAKEGEAAPTKTVYGATRVAVNTKALTSKSSDIKKFIAEAGEVFAEKLGKK